MIDSSKFPDWLTLEEGKPVKLALLALKIADTLYPGKDDEEACRVAREILCDDLQKAAQAVAPMNRTSAGPGIHRLEPVDVSLNAELIPGTDLERFLNTRGIGLRLIPPDNDGPVYWSLRNVALSIQKQEGWSVQTRDGFRNKLCEAACIGFDKATGSNGLVMRYPCTDLVKDGGVVRDNVDTVTQPDVNDWLERQGVTYRWKPQGGTTQRKLAIAEKIWTEEKLEELRVYRDSHKMSETVAHFGISQQRIRALLPRKKPKSEGNSAFNWNKK